MRRYPSRNKNGALIFILIVIFVGFIWAYNSGYVEIPSFNKCPEEVSLPENASFIIKEDGGIYPVNPLFDQPSYIWKDGQKIIGISRSTPFCFRGNKEGQKINYFYCNDLFYSKNILKYDSVGKITESGTENYKIILVLEPKPQNEVDKTFGITRFNTISSKCTKILSLP